MRRTGESNEGERRVTVELQDDLADREPDPASKEPSTRWPIWLRGLALAGVVAAYAIFLWWTGPGDVRTGELYAPLEIHFGDPFAVEWMTLEGPQDEESAFVRPPPMASTDPPCLGFGRMDWPESVRQPTVAFCFDPASTNRIADNGVSVLADIVSGDKTWYMIRFGREIDGLEVQLDGSTDLGRQGIFVGGPHAVLLLPNDHERVRLTWHISEGIRYECGFAQGLTETTTCG